MLNLLLSYAVMVFNPCVESIIDEHKIKSNIIMLLVASEI